MKRTVALVLLFILIATLFSIPSIAAGEVFVATGNTVLPLTDTMLKKSGSTWYIDYRYFTEGTLNVNVSYSAAELKLVLYDWDTTLIFDLNTATAYTTRDKVQYKAIAIVSSGTVYVPIQFTAQMLGFEYGYYPEIPLIRVMRPNDIPYSMFQYIAKNAIPDLLAEYNARKAAATKPETKPAPQTTQKPQAETKPAPQPTQKPQAETKPAPQPTQKPQTETKPAPQPTQKPQAETKPAPQTTQKPQAEIKPTAKPEVKPTQPTQSKPAQTIQTRPEKTPLQETKPTTKTEVTITPAPPPPSSQETTTTPPTEATTPSEQEETKENNRKISLTFNIREGDNFGKILNALSSNGFLATFFIDESAIPKCENEIRRAIVQGHTLGIYTNSTENLASANLKLFDVAKTKTRLVRFNGGSKALSKEDVDKVISLGYRLWDETIIPSGASTSKLYSNTVSQVGAVVDSAVLSLSDSKLHTSALNQILRFLKTEKYIVSDIDILDTPVNQISEKR